MRQLPLLSRSLTTEDYSDATARAAFILETDADEWKQPPFSWRPAAAKLPHQFDGAT